MSKVRADQFPNYSTVSLLTLRPDSKKTPLEYQHKCAFNPHKEILALLNISKNTENHLNSNTESP